MSLSFLIVQTDPDPARDLARRLEATGNRTHVADGAEAAAQALAHEPFDACLLGVEVGERLSLARTLDDRGMVVVLVGHWPLGGVEPELVGGLASDVVAPDLDDSALALLLQRVTRLRQVLSEREELRAARLVPLDDLLEGVAFATRRLRSDVERVAGTPRTTVLIQGEVGTRKDILAQGIHGISTRRRFPIRVLDGREATRTPFSSRLAERLTACAGGTLVVQEVASLSPSDQRELALVLGEPPTDVRFIATTSEDLDALAARGRFSEDLLYRLNVLGLQVPALRERAEDILGLAQRLLVRHAPAGRPASSLSEAAASGLTHHDWPGNVRELEACLIRAAHAARGEILHPGHLGLSSPSTASQNGLARVENAGLALGDRSLRHIEESLIRRVLEDERGNRSRTARILGINRSTLYNKLKLYGIE